ncbi:hypothetical protein M0802_003778 [Mischocyttarus mexicanus]|nr:hypothetical protein M0802_003778 [Mischocyttarus mexicanus]
MSTSKRKTIEINSEEESSPKYNRSSLAVNLSFTNFTDSGNGSLRKTHIKSDESPVQMQPYNDLSKYNKESNTNKQSDKRFSKRSIVNKTNNVSSSNEGQLLKNVSVRIIDIKHIKQTDTSFQYLRDAILSKTREIFNKQDECAIKTSLVLENRNNELLNTYSKNIGNQQQQLSTNGITNLQTNTQNSKVSIFSTPVKNYNDNESIDKSKKSKRKLFTHNDIIYPQIVETTMKENHIAENNLQQIFPRNLNCESSPIISGSHRKHRKSKLTNLSKNRTKFDTEVLSQNTVSSLNILTNEIESLDKPILCSTFKEELCGNNNKFIEEHNINNERNKKSATVVSMELTTVQNHNLKHYNTCSKKIDAIDVINSNQISNKKESEIQNAKEKINQTNSISDKESIMNQKTILITSNTVNQSSKFITEKNKSIKSKVNSENSTGKLESSLHVNTSMDNENDQECITKIHGSLQVNTSLNSTYKNRKSRNKEQSKEQSTKTSKNNSRYNNEIINGNNDSSNYVPCTPYNVFESNLPKSPLQMDKVIDNTKHKDSSKVTEILNKSNIKKINETVHNPETEPCVCKIHTTILCAENRKNILHSTVISDDSPFIASNKPKCKEVIIDESLSQQVTDKDKIRGGNNSFKNINVIPLKIKKKKLLPLFEDSKLSLTPKEKSSSPTPSITKKKKPFRKKRTIKQNLWMKACNVSNDVEKGNKDLSENNFSFNLKKKKERKNPRKVVSKKIVIKKMVDSDILRKLENLYKHPNKQTEVVEAGNSMNDFQTKKDSSQRLFHKSPKIIMVVTGFSKGDKSLIRSIVKSLGMASIEQNVTRRTTHVVSTGVRTINLLHGIIRGCWLVKLEWVLKSLENNKWLNPEDYELMHYSKAVKENRKDRELFGMAFVPDLFATSGFLHVENGTTPSAQVLKELIKAAGGRITEYPQAAKIIIGANGVKESWILDSITTGVLQSTEEYQRK